MEAQSLMCIACELFSWRPKVSSNWTWWTSFSFFNPFGHGVWQHSLGIAYINDSAKCIVDFYLGGKQSWAYRNMNYQLVSDHIYWIINHCNKIQAHFFHTFIFMRKAYTWFTHPVDQRMYPKTNKRKKITLHNTLVSILKIKSIYDYKWVYSDFFFFHKYMIPWSF